MCYCSPVSPHDIQSHRQHRLHAAIQRLTGGNVAAFGRLVGYRDGAFVRQMLAGTRVISEKTVHAVEALPGLCNWFAADAPAAASPPPPMQVFEDVATYEVARPSAGPQIAFIPVTTGRLASGQSRLVRTQGAEAGGDGAESEVACFPYRWLQQRGLRPSDLLALRMVDGSMEPSLHAGDIVTVNTTDTHPVEGAVYAANEEGRWLVRRLLRDRGGWWLTADNPLRYPRKELVSPIVVLIGRVMHVGSEVL